MLWEILSLFCALVLGGVVSVHATDLGQAARAVKMRKIPSESIGSTFLFPVVLIATCVATFFAGWSHLFDIHYPRFKILEIGLWIFLILVSWRLGWQKPDPQEKKRGG